MSSSPAAVPEALPPDAVMVQLMFSKMAFFSLAAIAKLQIADHLSATPREIQDIARDTGTNSEALYRALRMLVSLGVFAEGPARHFSLNAVGELLRSDHPRSMRDMAIMFGDPWQLQSYARMDDCIRTGTDGVTLQFGKHAFDLFRDIPDQAAKFSPCDDELFGRGRCRSFKRRRLLNLPSHR